MISAICRNICCCFTPTASVKEEEAPLLLGDRIDAEDILRASWTRYATNRDRLEVELVLIPHKIEEFRTISSKEELARSHETIQNLLSKIKKIALLRSEEGRKLAPLTAVEAFSAKAEKQFAMWAALEIKCLSLLEWLTHMDGMYTSIKCCYEPCMDLHAIAEHVTRITKLIFNKIPCMRVQSLSGSALIHIRHGSYDMVQKTIAFRPEHREYDRKQGVSLVQMLLKNRGRNVLPELLCFRLSASSLILHLEKGTMPLGKAAALFRSQEDAFFRQVSCLQAILMQLVKMHSETASSSPLVHGNLSIEHLLLFGTLDRYEIKFCGLSTVRPERKIKKTLHTLYSPPEYYENARLPASTAHDIWSFGVLAFQLLTEKFPFSQKNLKGKALEDWKILLSIEKIDPKQHSLLIDFFSRIFVIESEKRPLAKELLSHPLLDSFTPRSEDTLDESMATEVSASSGRSE